MFFFFNQMTAYELRISDWRSDVCSSDLGPARRRPRAQAPRRFAQERRSRASRAQALRRVSLPRAPRMVWPVFAQSARKASSPLSVSGCLYIARSTAGGRSEEHTSELQSLMRISYAVFCLKNKYIYIRYHTARTNNYI